MSFQQHPPLNFATDIEFNPIWLTSLFVQANRVWVAYSGGVDSHVLLHALVSQIPPEQKAKVTVMHVHHGLSPNADAWLDHCQQVCQALNVTFYAQKVNLKTQASLEDAARKARYQVFEESLSAEDVLLLAHHQGDQAETVLFRLARGSGTKGLAGMPSIRSLGDKGACLVRPFLAINKAQIEHYAKQHALHWVEDESNQDERFSRNFLRQNVIPLMKTHFPNLEQSVSNMAQRVADDYEMLASLSAQHLSNVSNVHGGLDLNWLYQQPMPQRRFWLRQFVEQKTSSLTQAQCDSVLNMFAGGEDKQPEFVFADGRLMRHQNALYVLPSERSVEYGALVIGQMKTRGFDQLRLIQGTGVELKARPLGAKLLLPNGQTRSLKKWLNDQQIPVWWREHLPYVFIQDELVAVANLWRHPDYGQLQFEWQPSKALPFPNHH
ncbi:tRNA lysidine(34) synthetase TilS [Marinomonas sp. TW1]|uniref:tRNA lysidine(34) synthetase TilS n=1 Tax=Marinomonas sp. TW1 TaxID=1561203 RepID=UPI0007AF02EB|nr:tRNA lysidine(34) synthetase TilS [Marinomonas sp. TW1]KZN12819.1 tRNA(Ile)-lysidine synthetase [Marinomonas sp. TW1]